MPAEIMHYQVPHNTLDARNIEANSHKSCVYTTRRWCQDKQQRAIFHAHGDERRRIALRALVMEYGRHRVVQPSLLRPLETFRDSKHLTSVMYDIARALEHIHKTGTFHRNVSVPNIMIDAGGNGILVDIDLAREDAARQPTRAGTWQFISTAQVCNPQKIYEVSDELESLFFVILYEGTHWVVHNKPKGLNVGYLFNGARFDARGYQIIGGKGKFCMYTLSPHTDIVLNQLRFERSPPFTDLLRELFLLFKSLAIVNRNKESGEELQDRDISNVEKLQSCRAVIQLMKNAVEREDWPKEHDKAQSDNYPGSGEFC